MQAPTIEFWYDFASTYSYLSAMRIERCAADAGVVVAWKPFLLGPIFHAQGWNTSPFNIYPAKGRYMIRDMQRLAAERQLPFRMPDPFPQHSLAAARVALATGEAGLIADFTRAAFAAEFGEGRDISKPDAIAAILNRVTAGGSHDSAGIAARSGERVMKDRLRTQSETAASVGIFGAPSFRTPDGELFWGDDRLQQAITWVATTTRG